MSKPTTREGLINGCVELKTRSVMYDANNCTSVEEEIAHLLRYYRPFRTMTDAELEAEWMSLSAEPTG